MQVTLEFSCNDDAPVNLAELRFHIPTTDLTGDTDPAEQFKEQVVKKANIVTTSTGDAVAIFREIHSLSPRGRYDIKMVNIKILSKPQFVSSNIVFSILPSSTFTARHLTIRSRLER